MNINNSNENNQNNTNIQQTNIQSQPLQEQVEQPIVQQPTVSVAQQIVQPVVTPVVDQPVQVVQPQQIFQPITTSPNQNITPNEPKKTKGIIVILLLVLIIGGIVGFLLINKPNNKDTKKEETKIENKEEPGEENEIEETKEESSKEENETTTDVDTSYDETGSFLMAIEDVFTITNKGTVVTGKVQRGKIKVGDTIEIIGINEEILTAEVTGIEMYRKELDEAVAGDNVGVILKDITRDKVQKGQVIAQPNSISAVTSFEANIYLYTKDEGGRHTPIFNNHKPQFYLNSLAIPGTIEFIGDIEMLSPGEKTKIKVTLDYKTAMEIGTEFTIREGEKTIAKGTVKSLK